MWGGGLHQILYMNAAFKLAVKETVTLYLSAILKTLFENKGFSTIFAQLCVGYFAPSGRGLSELRNTFSIQLPIPAPLWTHTCHPLWFL